VFGSVLLASVLLKMGGYGVFLIQSLFSIFCPLFRCFIFFTRFRLCVCLSQRDIKIVVAFSSVVHITLLVYVYSAFAFLGGGGGVILILSHSVSSGLFFITANEFYYFHFSRNLFLKRGGQASFSLFFFFRVLLILNVGLPPLLRFFGEVVFLFSRFLLRKLFLGVFLGFFILNLIFFLKIYFIFFF